MFTFARNRCSRSVGIGVHVQSESVFTFARNRCSRSLGIGVHIQSESVFTFARNRCSHSLGIGVHVQSEYALGFTVLVVNSIVPLETADFKTLLYTCWGALLLSIITSLAGYRIGNKAIKEARENAADYYLRGDESARTRENKWANWNTYNNYVTGFIFIFALVCLLLFIIMNVHSVSLSDCVGGSF